MLRTFSNLFKKEFGAYFSSNMFYFLIALYLFLSMVTCFYFGGYFSDKGASLSSFFSYQSYILMILTAAVTMRSWSEEKKIGTYELTKTYPVSYFQLVLSKYFSALAVMILLIVPTFLFWVFSNYVLELNNLIVLSEYFGLILMVAVFCAIGCFVSSLSSSVVLTYLFSVFFSWLVVSVDFNFVLSPLLLITPETYVQIEGFLNISRHINAFFSGLFSFSDLFFFISLSLVFILMNRLVIETKISKRQNLLYVIYFLVFYLIFVFANLFTTLLFQNYKVSMSSDSRDELSTSTKEIIKNLSKKVDVKVYVSEDISEYSPEYAQYVDYVLYVLNQYQRNSSANVSVDVRAVRQDAQSEVEAKENGLISFIAPGGESVIYFGAVFTDFSGKSYVIPNFLMTRKHLLQNDISRLFFKISNPELKKIGWVDVSGGNDFSDVRDLLENDYDVYDVEVNATYIPKEFDALVVPNFQSASIYFIYGLEQYIMRGGKVLLFADNYNEYQKIVKDFSPYALDFLKKFNLRFIPNKVVVDYNLSSLIPIEDVSGNKRYINNILKLNLNENNINQESLITKGLNNISFSSASVMEEIQSNEKVALQPLLSTSGEAGSVMEAIARLATEEYVGYSYEKDNQKYNLAYLVSGEISSSFPADVFSKGNDFFNHISLVPFKAIVVGDTSMLGLKGYSLIGDVFNPYMIYEPNDDYQFMRRSVDYLAGNEILLGVDNQTLINNPYDLASQISKKEQKKFSQEIDVLRKKIIDNKLEISKIEKSGNGNSIQNVKRINELNEINALEGKELRQKEYKLEASISREINYILLPWIVLFPAFFATVFFFAFRFSRFRLKKKIMEYVHEK